MAYPLATSHNGGKSQVNMNYMPTSGDYPFINVLKGASTGWTMESNVSSMPPNQLNANGYPIDLTGTGGGCYVRIFNPSQLERPGHWKMTWDGSGYTMGVGGVGLTTVTGSLTSGSYEFSLGAGATYLDVHIYVLGTGLTNFQVYHVDDETDLLAGNIFTKKFRDKLKEANFGVIRFLNWLNINTQMSTVWAYRKPITYWSWAAYQYPPELYAGTTTNTTSTYAVTVPGTLKHSSDGTTWVNGDAPKDKDTITVRFGASLTVDTMTLRVGTGGSTAAIPVVEPSCTPIVAAGNTYPLINRFGTFVYDATLAKWMKWGGDVANGYDTGIDNGLPIEVGLQLCAEIGAHPWFSFPPYALDPMTDFVPSMVTYVKNNQRSWMVPRFEVSNEWWNFYNASYGNAKSLVLWGSANFHEHYGKCVSTCGQAVNTIYGGSPHTQTAYQMSCAVQTGTGNTVGSCQNSDGRMAANAYFTQGTAPQSPYTKSRARDWVTHVTCANYFNPTGDAYPLVASLAASLGAARFIVNTCSAGTITVSSIETAGGALTSGMTLVGLGISPGTLVSASTGGATPTLTISDATLSLPSGYQIYAYKTANYSAVQDYIDTCDLPANFTGTIVGNTLTVNSTSSPTTGAGSIQVGMIISYTNGYHNGRIASLGTGTGGTGTYNLDGPSGPGDVGPIAMKAIWIFDKTYVSIILNNWKTWALTLHGVNKMNFYEGGYSPDYLPVGNYTSALSCMKYISKFVASTSRKATGLGGYTTDNYAVCTGLSDGSFTAEFPSQYLMTGPYPSLQIWNMLETIYRAPNGPQFDAIVAYNSGGVVSIGNAVLTYSLKGQ